MRYFVTLVSLVGPLVITLILHRSRKAGGKIKNKIESILFCLFAEEVNNNTTKQQKHKQKIYVSISILKTKLELLCFKLSGLE